MPSPAICSICFVYCNCRKRGARYKSKRCAPGSSKSALAFVKLRAASVFISPPAGLGSPVRQTRARPQYQLAASCVANPFVSHLKGGAYSKDYLPPSSCSTSYLLRSFNASRYDSNAQKQLPKGKTSTLMNY